MDKHCLLSRIFTTDYFSIVEVFTNGLLVIDLYNNSFCGMLELLFYNSFRLFILYSHECISFLKPKDWNTAH
jgi:hypothetical protein